MSQHHESEFLGHLERGKWFQGRGQYGEYLNNSGTLGVDGLHVAAPPALAAIDHHPIVRLSLSRDGGRVTVRLTETVGTSQDSLLAAVLEERTDVDYSHHGLLSPYRFFYVETFEYTREGGEEIIELDICE